MVRRGGSRPGDSFLAGKSWREDGVLYLLPLKHPVLWLLCGGSTTAVAVSMSSERLFTELMLLLMFGSTLG